MRTLGFSLLLALGVAGIACGGSDEDTTTASKPQASSTGGNAENGIELEELGTFEQPLYVTQPPSGDPDHVYVVEKCGTVQRVPIAGGRPDEYMDISDQLTCEGSEQGLLSIAFAPDYEDSGLLYVDYTDTEGNTRVVEYQASDDGEAVDEGSARELLSVEQPYDNHNGGLVLFGPDDLLYIGLGDGGAGGDPERRGQDLSTPLGKILRIDPRPSGDEPYGIPDDNPFADQEGALPAILAYGLRNPWRFSFDPDTGDLWIGDVGQDSLEEIDVATRSELSSGLNFGWSAFEGTERFNDDQDAPGAIPPVLEYPLDEACAVTGGYVVRDPALESLEGRYLYGDFCEGKLRSFTAELPEGPEDDRELGVEVPQLSSFGEDARGRIYATSLAGPVYRLTPAMD